MPSASVRAGSVVAAWCAAVTMCVPVHPPSRTAIPRADDHEPVEVMMDFTRARGFYTAPFPSEDLRTDGGRIDLRGFPNPQGTRLVREALALLESDADGFAATSEVAFQLSGPIDPSAMPDEYASVNPGASVFLVSVDRSAPDYLRRYPVKASFDRDGGPFGAPNFLTLLPVQGIPLRPHTLYAAVVLRALRDDHGNLLSVNAAMRQLEMGAVPEGMSPPAVAEYARALGALHDAGVDRSQIAGLAVFRTGDPTSELRTAVADSLALPRPHPTSPFVRQQEFASYCVYRSTIAMPDYQAGDPPYLFAGGRWAFDAAHKPVVQRYEYANVYVTIPRAPMPAAGFPAVVFIRAGAGSDRALVDRGVQTRRGAPPLVPGSGPAADFAHIGFAGASFDGPLGGLRNAFNLDEQYTIINVQNPGALRDNLREQAVELALFAHILDGVRIDAHDCSGVVSRGPVHLDTSTLAMMGHSLGATIAPLAVAFEPRYGALVLAGAGGSWIENAMYKRSPIAVRGVLEALLGYRANTLTEHDPALSILQWAGEPADPPVYDRYVTLEPPAGTPRNVYVVQGILDPYIMPPIADATTLSLGLDLAGPEVDMTDPRLVAFAPLSRSLALVGRHAIGLPASNNLEVGTHAATGVVVQTEQDMFEDGHEVIFQSEGPKHQYSCFLAS